MITGCLMISDMRWPSTRAMMSLGPPAGNGTIRRIWCDGKSSAPAGAADNSSNNAAKNPCDGFMDVLSTVEQLERRFVDARIAGRDDAAAALRGLAFPGRHHAAGSGDDRDQRSNVVRFQFGLDDEIEMAGRQHA